MDVPQLKTEVSWKCDLLQVFLAFGFQLDRAHKDAIEKARITATSATATELRNICDLLDRSIGEIATALGFKGKPEPFYRGFVELEFKGRFSYAYVPKYILEQLFANYSKMIRAWDSYPAQTLIGFDFGGEYEHTKTFEFFLPEIALYEDMCLAYNEAVASKYEERPGAIDKIRKKTHSLRLRTAVLSAFYFVEAYLNGIAFDFYFRTKGERQLSQDEIDKLGEFDTQRNRERWVSFKDKMLHYPKIVLGEKEPPLTEANCEELRILMSEAKALRDSLVHNSPRFEAEIVNGRRQLIGKKVKLILSLSLDEATTIVDAAVAFAEKVNALLQKRGHGQNLDWLYKRDATGLFPAKVFD